VPLTDVAPIEASIDIDAPTDVVWELLSDLSRMRRWSPQVVRTFVRGGRTEQGATMVNINRRGLRVWPTQAKVVAFEPGQKLAFRIRENWTIWSFTLGPTADGGTRVVQRREAPRGISDVSVRLTKVALGGTDRFTAELERGMQQTLQRIKDEVESAGVAA
jgi:uncharacterized protein YndB with AHSA1/START domain